MTNRAKLCISILCIALSCACAKPRATDSVSPTQEQAIKATVVQTTAFVITSRAFAHEEMIPAQYTCDGQDLSPALEWSTPPSATRSLALILDDPDAPMGTWVHWVLFNIPPDTQSLSQGMPADKELPDGSVQGTNSWSRPGYGGPCPPSGTHRYYFRLYALDTVLPLNATAGKREVAAAMEDHILAEAELMGKYARK
jgi:Raf kinase inhibitor-like YbhB/YbcL family protein